MSVDISVVSRHLSVLRDVGIMKSEKKGKEVYYTLRTKPLAIYLRSLADALESCCPDECIKDNKEEKV
jgi:DNA-binding transcriptional ArsR family regulator